MEGRSRSGIAVIDLTPDVVYPHRQRQPRSRPSAVTPGADLTAVEAGNLLHDRRCPLCYSVAAQEVLMSTYRELAEIAANHLVAGRSGSIGTIRVDAAQVEPLRHEVTLHPPAHPWLI